MITLWIICIAFNFLAIGAYTAFVDKDETLDAEGVIGGGILLAPLFSMLLIGFGIGKLVKKLCEWEME